MEKQACFVFKLEAINDYLQSITEKVKTDKDVCMAFSYNSECSMMVKGRIETINQKDIRFRGFIRFVMGNLTIEYDGY